MTAAESGVPAANAATGKWRAALLRDAAAMRAWGRWLCVPALTMWPLYLLAFDVPEARLFLAFACLAPLGLAILLGGLAIAIDVALDPRRRPQPRRWRGRWLAGAAIVGWSAIFRTQADARLWLWRNEGELARVVARARVANAPRQPDRLGDYTVSVVGPTRAVVVHLGLGSPLGDYGVAWDPEQSLRPGAEYGVQIDTLRPLRGAWRAWSKRD